MSTSGFSAAGSSAASSSAAGSSAAGSSAAGSSAAGFGRPSATGSSTTGSSKTGSSATGSSTTGTGRAKPSASTGISTALSCGRGTDGPAVCCFRISRSDSSALAQPAAVLRLVLFERIDVAGERLAPRSQIEDLVLESGAFVVGDPAGVGLCLSDEGARLVLRVFEQLAGAGLRLGDSFIRGALRQQQRAVQHVLGFLAVTDVGLGGPDPVVQLLDLLAEAFDRGRGLLEQGFDVLAVVTTPGFANVVVEQFLRGNVHGGHFSGENGVGGGALRGPPSAASAAGSHARHVPRSKLTMMNTTRNERSNIPTGGTTRRSGSKHGLGEVVHDPRDRRETRVGVCGIHEKIMRTKSSTRKTVSNAERIPMGSTQARYRPRAWSRSFSSSDTSTLVGVRRNT